MYRLIEYVRTDKGWQLGKLLSVHSTEQEAQAAWKQVAFANIDDAMVWHRVETSERLDGVL